MGKRPLPRPASREQEIPSTLSAFLEEAGRHRLLTRAEEIQLARRIERGDRGARDRLVLANLRLVVAIARHYWLPPGSALTLTDLVHEGFVGLIRAAELFDPRAGTRFSTYASLWIRQAIARALAGNSLIRLPHAVQRQLRLIGATERELRSRLGREPTEEEVAEQISFPISELTEARRRTTVLSLDEPLEAGATLADTVSNSRDAAVEVETAITERALREHVAALPERLRDILVLHYGLAGDAPLSLAKIGQRLGLSRERVRQLKTRALSELRDQARHEQPARPTSNRLRAFDPLSWLATLKASLLGSAASTVTTGVLVTTTMVAGGTGLPAFPNLPSKARAPISEPGLPTGVAQPRSHKRETVAGTTESATRMPTIARVRDAEPRSNHRPPMRPGSTTSGSLGGDHVNQTLESPGVTQQEQAQTESTPESHSDTPAPGVDPARANDDDPNAAATPAPSTSTGADSAKDSAANPDPAVDASSDPRPQVNRGPPGHSTAAADTGASTEPPTEPGPLESGPQAHSNAATPAGPPTEAGPPSNPGPPAHSNAPAHAGPPPDVEPPANTPANAGPPANAGTPTAGSTT
jgi:RNA polymerase primary sigma factor